MRKSLLIGINYTGQTGALRGCVNDVATMRHFLHQQGYRDEDMKVLVDDQRPFRSSRRAPRGGTVCTWGMGGSGLPRNVCAVVYFLGGDLPPG